MLHFERAITIEREREHPKRRTHDMPKRIMIRRLCLSDQLKMRNNLSETRTKYVFSARFNKYRASSHKEA